MKMSKNLALMALGAGAVLAYQKYNKPIRNQVEKVIDKTMKKSENQLGNMM
ncbi:MAG TPA: hypothetical protein GXZ63_00210 [Mollicutes bacterium]|jgi:hypothetical protein|nr:hypothetical protein [Mollicutes bacterium]